MKKNKKRHCSYYKKYHYWDLKEASEDLKILRFQCRCGIERTFYIPKKAQKLYRLSLMSPDSYKEVEDWENDLILAWLEKKDYNKLKRWYQLELQKLRRRIKIHDIIKNRASEHVTRKPWNGYVALSDEIAGYSFKPLDPPY